MYSILSFFLFLVILFFYFKVQLYSGSHCSMITSYTNWLNTVTSLTGDWMKRGMHPPGNKFQNLHDLDTKQINLKVLYLSRLTAKWGKLLELPVCLGWENLICIEGKYVSKWDETNGPYLSGWCSFDLKKWSITFWQPKKKRRKRRKWVLHLES